MLSMKASRLMNDRNFIVEFCSTVMLAIGEFFFVLFSLWQSQGIIDGQRRHGIVFHRVVQEVSGFRFEPVIVKGLTIYKVKLRSAYHTETSNIASAIIIAILVLVIVELLLGLISWYWKLGLMRILLPLEVLIFVGIMSQAFLNVTGFNKHLRFVFIGSIICVAAAAAVNYRLSLGLFRTICALMIPMALFCLAYGRLHPINGSGAWVFGLQPGEFFKILILLLCCLGYGYLRTDMISLRLFFVAMAMMLIAVVGVNDLGNGIIIFSLMLITLISIGLWEAAVVIVGSAAVLSIVFFDKLAAKIISRFSQSLFHPLFNFEDSWANQNIRHALLTLVRGGMRGTGVESSNALFASNVYASHTDFAFTCAVSVFGFAFGILILIALFVLTVNVSVSLKKSGVGHQDLYQANIIVCLYLVQAMVHIFGSLSLIPMTGVTLPFISAGGSSMWSSYIAAGALIGLYLPYSARKVLANPFKSLLTILPVSKKKKYQLEAIFCKFATALDRIVQKMTDIARVSVKKAVGVIKLLLRKTVNKSFIAFMIFLIRKRKSVGRIRLCKRLNYIPILLGTCLLGGSIFSLLYVYNKGPEALASASRGEKYQMSIEIDPNKDIYNNEHYSSTYCVADINPTFVTADGEEIVGTIDAPYFNLVGENADGSSRYLMHVYSDEAVYEKVYNMYAGIRRSKPLYIPPVRLTLNGSLQRKIYDYYVAHGIRGCVFCYDYDTGEILCAVSTPGCSSDDAKGELARKKLESGSLMNKCLYSTPPGSTMKTVTLMLLADSLAAKKMQIDRLTDNNNAGDTTMNAKERRIISLTEELETLYYSCDGSVTIDGNEYHCAGRHGRINASQAVGASCNCWFAQAIYEHLDAGRVYDILTSLGWSVNGSKTEKPLGKVFTSPGSVKLNLDNWDYSSIWSLIGETTVEVSPSWMAGYVASAIARKSAIPCFAESEKGATNPLWDTYSESIAVAGSVWRHGYEQIAAMDYPDDLSSGKTGTYEFADDRTQKTYVGVSEALRIAFFFTMENYEDGGRILDVKQKEIVETLLREVEQIALS